ncbi:MAG TPA: amino acid carrier protein [Candidatus Eisenbergiella merdipullorum]|uniref:Amino acid carrier protein n=1 Tax=Candidatus Eisenbergiella merdipullorum TaxID=2838553 RepID=A0A9D2I6T5_9FIRM|nr:amino acid carrier protein [Candidatus Eisenbergiella merdipullorum]
MLSILERVNQFLWGFPLLLLLAGAHLYFTIKLRFPQKYTIKAIRLSVTPEKGNSSGLSGFAALATTLAATLGTGNIIGVSTAVAIGGPGALFWCWITGILGMATCYAECYLSVLFSIRKKDGTCVGGPMYVLEEGLHSRPLGMVYAACVVLAAFGVGCTTQSSSITEAVHTVLPVSPHLIGILAAVTAGLVILGGVRSIGTFCSRMVPALGFFYIACCLYLLFLNRDALLPACSLIVESAFSPRVAAGGFIGSTVQSAARYGIARGLFTNEAGIGTAAIAAASSGTKDPRRQGLISMTAVFWDTVVMCAVTGLVIVSNILKNPASIAGYSSASLTTAAFTFLPLGGAAILSFSLVAFALTTLIGWCYYGERAVEYLFGNQSLVSYHLCYIVMIYIGAVLPMDLVWSVTDLINALMVFPSCLALFALRKKIRI